MIETDRKKAPALLPRLWHAAWRWLWRATAFVLILTAVLMTLARMLLPFAADYREEFEHRVESYLGADVAIGALDIDWHGFGPRVQISDLRVFDVGPARETLAFDQAYVTLRPVLDAGVPNVRIGDFSLVGFTIETRIDNDGRMHVFGAQFDPAVLGAAALPDAAIQGADAADDETGPADTADERTRGEAEVEPAMAGVLDQVLSIRRLRLLQATVVVSRPDGEVTRWRDIGLVLLNEGDRHSISVDVSPPSSWGNRVMGRLEFTGQPADYRHWRASMYLDARELALDRLSALSPDAPVAVGSGRLDFRLWSDWDDGHLLEARAEIGADHVSLAEANGPGTARFERVAGRVRMWQPSPRQWQIDVGGLEVLRGGRAWQGDSVSYALQDDGAWRLATDFLRAEDVAAVAGLLPLDSGMRARLAESEPRGDVHGLMLAVSADGRFHLESDFRDLGWSASDGVPGATGLDGRVSLRSEGGRVVLESTGVGFNAPELFRAPLRMQELSAVVGLRPTDSGYSLVAPRIHVSNRDLRGRGRARIDLVRGESPLLDLQFRYHDGVATSAYKYLPAGIMPGPVVEWLDQAFLAGRVPNGDFIMRGRVEDFPYRAHNGIFDVRFDIEDATLFYGAGWPAIEGLEGRVHFAGAALDIFAGKGRTRGLRLNDGHARFADLRKGLLQVQLDATGPLADMLGVVRDSPLRKRFAPVLDGAGATGGADLELALSVPVDEVEETRVEGEVRFAGAAVSQSTYGLAFDRVQGGARFTERSVTIDDLRARLRDRPVRLDAATRDGIARFGVQGEFAPAELLPALADGPLAGSKGRSGWRVDLSVPLTVPGSPRLEAVSDLAGTQVDLPPPLGKVAEEPRPLHLSMGLDRKLAHVRYGETTHLMLDLSAGDGFELRRAALAFSRDARLPDTRGLRVSGELDRLDATPWIDLALGTARGGDSLPLVALDLRATRLDLADYRLSRARLEGGRNSDGNWQLAIVSNEATGSVLWPLGASSGSRVDMRFELIDLALMQVPDDDMRLSAEPGLHLDPARLPSLELRVDRLKMADFTLQDFAVVTGSGRRATTIHQFGFTTQHLKVTGQGEWRGGANPRTRLRVVMRSDNFGRGLDELGHGGLVADGDGRVTAELEWPGAPWQPQVATLSGNVDIRIEDGVLTQVDPGAARLLGMFSLDAVPFRTLLQSGLIFGELGGRVDLEDGNAYTNLLKIDSAVGLIKISGRTGLVARDYDQRIVVLPELSTSLPLIGFLSGGPVAGAAIALIQGVMRNLGQDVEKASQVEYTVTGSWDDPLIKRVDKSGAEIGSGSSGVAKPEVPR